MTSFFQSDLSRDKEMPSKENEGDSDRQKSDDVPCESSKQRTLLSWLTTSSNSLRKPKDRNDELPKLPKRQIVPKPPPPPPDTTSSAKTINKAIRMAREDVQNHDDEDDEMNGAVTVSSDSPNVITQFSLVYIFCFC